ncbi:TetR/AcrR family transcriptional regulator [Spirilliplanes yamanashiensis]|uniref:TetR family transcriptional regulator n=1 Tax=Spirilliplanes yamanashiensis TaxID=42233 RepID=A0A8J3Y4Q6_9ACTN|nr:TetR/AcrR family transcriptional regulator [Spirilliplanes yamanashiensis]MDP9819465.1 AcrR family transcriptional regulator [Spirilliplanes yamanashiensis]GIJ01713.1 TetR family transcriptional regulator [Spirilliplanes yamanashiensis]
MTATGQGRRRYDARSRQNQARENRDRVLAVARRLFVAHGYAAVPVARIAAEAGVSSPTVFAAFGSKVGLLKEAVDTAIAGDTADRPLRDRPVLTRVHEAATFDELVERLADAFAEVAPRAYPIWSVVQRAADADPQIAALFAELEAQRLAGAGLLAATVADRLGGADADAIRDSLWVLQSPHQYGLFVHDRGRSVAEYRAWTARALRALLPPLG